jgi:hypothetical protein
VFGRACNRIDLPRFLNRVLTLTFYRMSRLYSTFVVILFTMKLWLYMTFTRVQNTVEAFPGWDVLRHYLLPEEIPVWHIAAALNAALAWIILFQAEHDLTQPLKPEESTTIQNKFKILLVIRNVISIYVSLCTLYITWQIATKFTLPRFRFFPW